MNPLSKQYGCSEEPWSPKTWNKLKRDPDEGRNENE